MSTDAQKRAEKRYRQSKKGKATQVRHRQTEKGKITHARSVFKHAQTKKGKIIGAHATARYMRTSKGKIAEARKKAKREQNLGYKPINNWFEGSHGHHIDKENVLFIPAELHKSISHRQDNSESMKEINDAAFEWFYIEEVI